MPLTSSPYNTSTQGLLSIVRQHTAEIIFEFIQYSFCYEKAKGMTLNRQKLITFCLCNMFATIQLSTRLNVGGFIGKGRDDMISVQKLLVE